MKKNIGIKNVLSPMPLTVIGTKVNGQANYILVGHTGIMDHSTLSVSIHKSRYSVIGIQQNMELSINLVSENMLKSAKEAAKVSGAKEDKSQLFEAEYGKLKNAPMIKDALICMECRVTDVYERPDFYNYICEIVNTYADEKVLTEENTIDYTKTNLILFAPQSKYWKMGSRAE